MLFVYVVKNCFLVKDGSKSCADEDPDYMEPKDYKPHQIPSRMAGKIPENEKNGRRSRRYQASGEEEDEVRFNIIAS